MNKKYNDDDLIGQEILTELKYYSSYVFNLLYDETVGEEVLDYGSGHGDFCLFLDNKKIKSYGYEPNEKAFQHAFANSVRSYLSLNDIDKTFPTVTSLCVLEHIEDDMNALMEIKSLLNSNGRLILYLPASMTIWSQMDLDANHYRRYSKKEITKKLNTAGFQIEKIHYVDFLGWIVLFLFRIFRIKPKFNKKLIIFYDKYFFKYLKSLDLFFNKIIGKNLLIVAKINK